MVLLNIACFFDWRLTEALELPNCIYERSSLQLLIGEVKDFLDIFLRQAVALDMDFCEFDV